MMPTDSIVRLLSRFPRLPALSYAVLIVALCLTTPLLLLDLLEKFIARRTSAELLAELQTRAQVSSMDPGSGQPGPAGSSFLEGPTVTVASAALLQRITSAIGQVGGNVISSEVEQQGPLSKDGYVSVTATCELEYTALQQLLYDLEAGMPFLFIDHVLVQGLTPTSEEGRIRLVLGLSGLWSGGK